MLKPDERTHLLELLRPPIGCQLDLAVGTTFSLDLMSALMLPLSFAFFDWEHADGQLKADPLALLEALRRYGSRFTVFCQSGQIRLPPKYPPLVAFLEGSIYDVRPPDPKGVFHPKVWALRFVAQDGAVRYRVLCLSRNLTFDRCWDTVVALDGELGDRSNAIAANHPLGDFVAALPKLALRPVTTERREGIKKMADELRRVRFTWPEGFDENQCRFWVAGLDGRKIDPFGERREQSLIVSPFLSDAVVRDFLEYDGATHLVSRHESLQELPSKTLRECKTVHFLQPEPTDEIDHDGCLLDRAEVLDGLHAKLFVVDHGWDASVYSGSFNATSHALEHNVEFMVEMVGKKSRFGVTQFLRSVKGETNFSDLLQKYDPDIVSPAPDPAVRQLDELCHAIKRALAAALPRLVVSPAGEGELFDMRLSFTRALRWPPGKVVVRAWPITQHAERAQVLGSDIIFPRLSYEGLTPLIAFGITAEVVGAKGESIFVMNLPLEGAPADRHDRLLRSMFENRDQVLRYLLFLLAAGDEAAASSDGLAALLTDATNGTAQAASFPCLLETMLRTLHRGPSQLERVESLLESLRKSSGGSALLTPEFQSVWEPIWATAKEAKEK
jgi:hypothetical protein